MNQVLRSAVNVGLLLLIAAPLVHLLKVAHVTNDVGTVMFYTGFPILVMLLMVGGIWAPNEHDRRPHLFIGLILAMLLSSAMMTGWYEGDPVDIAGNVLRVLFVFSSIFFLTNSGPQFTRFLDAKLPMLVKLSLISSAAATVLMHLASMAGFVVYFGLQTTVAFIPFAYGLVYRRVPLVLLSLLPLIGAGKRGVMLGAITILLVYIAMAVGRVRLHRVIAVIGVIGALFALLYIFELLPDPILARVDFFFADRDIDLNQTTSGRFMEAEAAVQQLNSHPAAWITGFGLGSAINITGYVGSEASTVHFSPLAMVMIFGLPMTTLFYCAVLYYISTFFLLCRSGAVPREFVVLYLVFIAEVVFSLTAFTMLQSYLLWIALAYLIAARRNLLRTGAPISLPLAAGSHSSLPLNAAAGRSGVEATITRTDRVPR